MEKQAWSVWFFFASVAHIKARGVNGSSFLILVHNSINIFPTRMILSMTSRVFATLPVAEVAAFLRSRLGALTSNLPVTLM